MELNINVSKITVAIDATPALLAAISAITGSRSNQNTGTSMTSIADDNSATKAPTPTPQPVPSPEPTPQPEAKKDDKISDADMRKVIGPAVQKHGQQAVIDILNFFGITTNRTTDVPQEKRAEFLEKIKALG